MERSVCPNINIWICPWVHRVVRWGWDEGCSVGCNLTSGFCSVLHTGPFICLCLYQDHDYLYSRRRGMSKRLTRDLPLVKLLNISITLSPFLGVGTTQFHTSLMDGTETYWLSLPSAPQGQLVRLPGRAVFLFTRGPFDFILVVVVLHFLNAVTGPFTRNIPRVQKTLNFPRLMRTRHSF